MTKPVPSTPKCAMCESGDAPVLWNGEIMHVTDHGRFRSKCARGSTPVVPEPSTELSEPLNPASVRVINSLLKGVPEED